MSLAWSEGTDSRTSENQKSDTDVGQAESYLLITPITLANLSR